MAENLKIHIDYAKLSRDRDIQDILMHLNETVTRDRAYFVKISLDRSFEQITEEVNALLDIVLENVRENARKELDETSRIIERMEELNVMEFAPHYYGDAKDSQVEAEEKYNSRSYFGYLDSMNMSEKARELANLGIAEQIKKKKKQIKRDIERVDGMLSGELDSFVTSREEFGAAQEKMETVGTLLKTITLTGDNCMKIAGLLQEAAQLAKKSHDKAQEARDTFKRSQAVLAEERKKKRQSDQEKKRGQELKRKLEERKTEAQDRFLRKFKWIGILGGALLGAGGVLIFIELMSIQLSYLIPIGFVIGAALGGALIKLISITIKK